MTLLEMPRMPKFRPGAAAELAGFFLQQIGGETDWLTILKLLYYTEKRALERYEWPIIFDRMYCFPQGPVPETVYRLLKEEVSYPEWSEVIESKRPHTVRLRIPPTTKHLSQVQLDIAREVFKENEGKSGLRMSAESHSLEEWTDPQEAAIRFPMLPCSWCWGRARESRSAFMINWKKRRSWRKSFSERGSEGFLPQGERAQ